MDVPTILSYVRAVYEQAKHKQGIIVTEPCLEWQNKFLAGLGESPVSQTHNPDAENALEDVAEEITE